MIAMAIPVYYIYIGVVFVVAFAVTAFMSVRMRGRASGFTAKHPDAARLYTTPGSSVGRAMKASFTMGDLVTVRAIDGLVADATSAAGLSLGAAAGAMSNRDQDIFAREVSGAILVAPGEHTLSLVASHSRPGVTARTVTTVYGPTDVRVTLEPQRSYTLTFDRDSQQFGIQERAV